MARHEEGPARQVEGADTLHVDVVTEPASVGAAQGDVRRTDALGASADKDLACIIMELLPEAGLSQDVLTMLIESPSAPRVICVAVDSAPQFVIE